MFATVVVVVQCICQWAFEGIDWRIDLEMVWYLLRKIIEVTTLSFIEVLCFTSQPISSIHGWGHFNWLGVTISFIILRSVDAPRVFSRKRVITMTKMSRHRIHPFVISLLRYCNIVEYWFECCEVENRMITHNVHKHINRFSYRLFVGALLLCYQCVCTFYTSPYNTYIRIIPKKWWIFVIAFQKWMATNPFCAKRGDGIVWVKGIFWNSNERIYWIIIVLS